MLNKLFFLTLAVAAGTCFAQASEELKFYKLEFVLKEVEGAKVLNSRSYSMTISNETKVPSSSIRTGARVPVQITPGSINTMEVGVNIDCRLVKEMQRGLALSVIADISSVPSEPSPGPAFTSVRQNKWSSTAIVPLKKPTLIFTADDTTSKRQLQLEVTATPIG